MARFFRALSRFVGRGNGSPEMALLFGQKLAVGIFCVTVSIMFSIAYVLASRPARSFVEREGVVVGHKREFLFFYLPVLKYRTPAGKRRRIRLERLVLRPFRTDGTCKLTFWTSPDDASAFGVTRAHNPLIWAFPVGAAAFALLLIFS